MSRYRFLLLAPLLLAFADGAYTLLDADDAVSGSTDEVYGYVVAGQFDADGDGMPDIAVGAPLGDAVYVYADRSGGSLDLGQAISISGFSGSELGWDITSGDVIDSDGEPDLIIGAPAYDIDHGAVCIFGAGSLTADTDCTGADLVLFDTERSYTGISVITGDFDGDGEDELAVGAQAANDSDGVVFLIETPLPTGTRQIRNVADAVIEGGFADFLAGDLAAGDFDGDGQDELIIGSPGAVNGSTHIVWDPPLSGTHDIDTLPEVTEFTYVRFSDLGSAVLSGFDLNDDGYEDIAIGAPFRGCHHFQDNSTSSCYGGPYTGDVFVLLGSASAASDLDPAELIYFNPSIKLDGQSVNNEFGWRLAAGDFDGDGYDDLMVGGHGSDHTVYGWRGDGVQSSYTGTFFDTDAPVVLDGSSAADFFGAGLANVGDLDGDGADDLAVTGTGREWLYEETGGTGSLSIWNGTP